MMIQTFTLPEIKSWVSSIWAITTNSIHGRYMTLLGVYQSALLKKKAMKGKDGKCFDQCGGGQSTLLSTLHWLRLTYS